MVLHHWLPRVLVAALVYCVSAWLAVKPGPDERQMLRFFIDRRRST